MTLPYDPARAAVELDEATKSFSTRRLEFIQRHMRDIGIAAHERTAKWDQIPEAVRKALPTEWRGFGLSGSFGIGKTFALVAAIHRHAEEAVDRRMEEAIRKGDRWVLREGLSFTPWPLWVNWPGESAARRAQLFQNEHREVEAWIIRLQDPGRLLILDDLGADSTTAKDWTGEVLARVIDERLRREAVTVWTSNLDTKGLVDRYGPRTFSRLQALAPAIQLPKMPDLRLVPERRTS